MSVAEAPGHDRICLSNIAANFEKLKQSLAKIVNSSFPERTIVNGLKIAW